MSIIGFHGVNAFFGDFRVFKDIDLSIEEGEVVVVIGPSGSGKSTVIRCINGLEKIASGELVVDGKHVEVPKTSINKVRSEIGVVFQQFNLYPHMTVAQNIKLAPRNVTKVSAKATDERCRRLLNRVVIPEQANKHPESLSGGQHQRVAIARAGDGAQDHALRRADERAGPGDDNRGPRGDGGPRSWRHDDGVVPTRLASRGASPTGWSLWMRSALSRSEPRSTPCRTPERTHQTLSAQTLRCRRTA